MVLDQHRSTGSEYEELTSTKVRPTALDLCRMRWDLMEIAGYIAFFRAPHAETRDAAASWENLQDYLDIERRWPPR